MNAKKQSSQRLEYFLLRMLLVSAVTAIVPDLHSLNTGNEAKPARVSGTFLR